ncbi:MAG TPA: hypothetical protein VG722_04220 [Tepidisphaeraceae bacterium]|nr:hypothetical protein [Tepidisphaeraceae bacterium]
MPDLTTGGNEEIPKWLYNSPKDTENRSIADERAYDAEENDGNLEFSFPCQSAISPTSTKKKLTSLEIRSRP